MPVVPTFNSNIPTVQDRGVDFDTPAQAPRENYDYASLMKVALAPINEFATTAVKAIELERARVIKAESDDAEREVIKTINDYMHHEETGYLTKQGKNAMQDFEPTMQSMQKDINGIMGKLSPQAQQAIESRVFDRMENAFQRARVWNAQQTRNYQVDSSSARIDALVNDCADHAEDKAYVLKTKKSVDDEWDYIANLKGLDADTLSKYKNATWDKIQAMRFEEWANKDPLTAFAVFQNEKDEMSPEIRDRLDNSLWQSSKGLLAAQLAAGGQMFGSEEELLKAINARKMGNPVIDQLSPGRKAELFSSVWASQKKRQAEYTESLIEEARNTLAEASETGGSSRVLDEGAFIQAYGDEKGAKKYLDYKRDFDARCNVHKFAGLTVDAMDAIIAESTPKPGDSDYADMIKTRDALVKAKAAVIKLRKTDPVAFSISNDEMGYKPLDFSNIQQASIQIEHRASNAAYMADAYGTPERILTKAELSQAEGMINSMDPTHAHAFIQGLNMGEEAVQKLALQIRESDSASNFDIPFAMQADEKLTGYVPLYLEGERAIREGKVNFKDQAATNTKGFDDVSAPIYAATKGLYPNPVARAKMETLARNVAAGLVYRDGKTPKEAMDEVIKKIIGVRVDYRGAPVSLFEGAGMSDIEDAVGDLKKEIKSGGLQVTLPHTVDGRNVVPKIQAMDLVDRSQLINTPERNVFHVAYGPGVLRDKKGNPIRVTVKPYAYKFDSASSGLPMNPNVDIGDF